MVQAKKVIKKIFVIVLVLLLIYILFYIYLFTVHREYIPVHYVASYEISSVDHLEFYGYYTVGDLKVRLGEEDWIRTFGELEGLRKKLDKLDDNTRIVISLGSGIRYFWIPKDRNDYDGFIRVAYQNKKIQNKIYIYTTEYKGSIVDINYL